MNILMELNNPGIGGARTHVIALAQALHRRGHRLQFVTDAGFLEREMAARGLHYQPRVNGLEQMVNLLLSLAEREGTEVLHAHAGATELESCIIHEKLGLPYVVTIHGLFLWHLSDADLGDRIAKTVHKVIAVSGLVRDFILKHSRLTGDKVKVIPNGVDLEEFRPGLDAAPLRAELGIEDDEAVVVYSGRLASEKRHAIMAMIDAVRELAKRGLRIRGVFAGKTDVYLHSTLVSLCRDARMETGRELLMLTGPRRDIPQLLSLADIVVATGRAALESLAVGKPTVAWGCGGYLGPVTPANWREALNANFGDHGGPPGPSPSEFAGLLDELLRRGQSAAMTAQLNDLVSEDCDIKKVAAETESIYGEAIAARI